MAGALGIGLRRGNNLDIVKELMPEAAVNRCSVVCSIPPLYQSTGVQYSSAC